MTCPECGQPMVGGLCFACELSAGGKRLTIESVSVDSSGRFTVNGWLVPPELPDRVLYVPPEPVDPDRGTGRTTQMLVDADRRKQDGLRVLIVLASAREIKGALSLTCGTLEPRDFVQLSSVREWRLRGLSREDVFVDHHAYEVGDLRDLEELDQIVRGLR